MSDPRQNEKLAVHGGEPVRRERMPPRLVLGDEEVRMIQEVIAYYREQEVDPGYQGPFEKLYTDAFVAAAMPMRWRLGPPRSLCH